MLLVPQGRTKPRTRLDGDGLTARRGVVLLAVSVVTGLLVAGLAFPVVGALGITAKAGAEQFENLPRELVEPPLPQSSRITAADGTTLAIAYFNENRIVVPLKRVPKVMQDAILAIEDERFYQHNGVDLQGLVRAVIRNSQAGEVQQGGSTITQQYVKNVLIAQASKGGAKQTVAERTAARKIREARLALALEKRYTKQQILEKYLNIAYFGNGVYGVGTAARHYFSKRVDQLTMEESALLAGIVKNPRLYDPQANPKDAKTRRDLVLDRMAAAGFAKADDTTKAQRTPIRLRLSRDRGFEDNETVRYYLDYVRSAVLDDPDGTMAPIFGDTPAARAQKLFQGGLTIRTSLDAKLQRHVLATLKNTLGAATDPASAAVVIEPRTGYIKAMAGLNHEKKSFKVNLPLGGSHGFQAGSTFKVFVLAAAIEQGIPLNTQIRAPETYESKVFDNYVDGRIEPYKVSNAGDSEQGTFDIVRATWDSVNTAYIQIEEKTGLNQPAQIARDMGMKRFPVRAVPSLVLGSNEVSPLDLANAYATLAARGVYCKPIAITEVRDARNGVIGKVDPDCRKVLSEKTADTVTQVLRGVLTNGTGKGARIDRPAAGKTGTTNGPTAAWFAGYTPDLAAAVWVGYPTDPNKHLLRNIKGVRTVYGGTFPATMWRAIMTAAHAGLPVSDFVSVKIVTTPPKPVATAPPKPTEPKPDERCRKRCRD